MSKKQLSRPNKFKVGQLWKVYATKDDNDLIIDYDKYMYFNITRLFSDVETIILVDKNYTKSRPGGQKWIGARWTINYSACSNPRFIFLGKYKGCLVCHGLSK